MADEVKNVGATTSSSGDQAKPTRVSTELQGVRNSNGAAIFKISYSDGSSKNKEFPREEILKALTQILNNPTLLDNKKNLINGDNFWRIINSYRQANQLGDELTALLAERGEAIRQRNKALAKPTIDASQSMVGMSPEIIEPSTAKIESKLDQPFQVENFNQKEDKNNFLQELFSEQSRSKVLSALAPHFRFILQKPDLTDVQIREIQSDSIASPQQKTDLNRLREAFRTAVFKNETVSLRNWLLTDTGKKVSTNLEAVLYETASHVHGQIQHQLKKGKGADQKAIELQLETYVKTTIILASIAKKVAETSK